MLQVVGKGLLAELTAHAAPLEAAEGLRAIVDVEAFKVDDVAKKKGDGQLLDVQCAAAQREEEEEDEDSSETYS